MHVIWVIRDGHRKSKRINSRMEEIVHPWFGHSIDGLSLNSSNGIAISGHDNCHEDHEDHEDSCVHFSDVGKFLVE